MCFDYSLFLFKRFDVTNFVFIGLRILFELVNRIDKANEPIQKYLEEYVYKVGMDAINCITATANKVN